MRSIVLALLALPFLASAKSAVQCELELELKPLAMLTRYMGEDDFKFHAPSMHALRRLPPGMEGAFSRPAPLRVIYLPENERNRQEVLIGADGRFRWPDGRLVTAGLSQPRALFVLMKVGGDFRLFLWPEPEHRRYQHSSLSAGQVIYMGGEMSIDAGRLLFMSNRCGHYEPSNVSFLVFERWLRARGADLSRADVRPFAEH